MAKATGSYNVYEVGWRDLADPDEPDRDARETTNAERLQQAGTLPDTVRCAVRHTGQRFDHRATRESAGLIAGAWTAIYRCERGSRFGITIVRSRKSAPVLRLREMAPTKERAEW